MERDTAPEALARYRARIGAMSMAEKAELTAGLTQAARDLAEAGLRARHPGASEEELRCRFVALLYGREIAERLFDEVPPDVR